LVRVVGIDPGTKTMDLCLLEDGVVKSEVVLESSEVAFKPELLVKAVEKLSPYDLIVGPSGYGVEVTYIDEIPDDVFEDWYYTYILLTTKEEIERGVAEGDVGSYIYYAMAKTMIEFKKRRLPVVFIPGIINLLTVQGFKKLNKIDLGTADKLAVAVLATHLQAERLRIPYGEVSFILSELGFGYNAVVGVSKGLIMDAFGGTTMPGPGFLSMGCADLELVQLVRNWSKTDVFTGGLSYVSGCRTPEELAECSTTRPECLELLNAMVDGIMKAVHALTYSVGVPKEVLYSGRLSRINLIRNLLISSIKDSAVLGSVRVAPVGSLPGAKITKETAQGYALVGDGVAGGFFRGLINHMRVTEAKGSALDYVKHPKFDKRKLVRFK
jgi:predicted butyrate kinase (DUF1464 family)